MLASRNTGIAVVLLGCYTWIILAEGLYGNPALALFPIRSSPGWRLPSTQPVPRQGVCRCHHYVCGCCANFFVPQLMFRRTGCLNFTYNETELAVTMNLLLDNSSVFQASLSGKNPPPVCIPIPQLPVLSICIRLYNLHSKGEFFYACLNLEVRIQGIIVTVFKFDCLRFGPSGLTVIKPNQFADFADALQLDGQVPSESPMLGETQLADKHEAVAAQDTRYKQTLAGDTAPKTRKYC